MDTIIQRNKLEKHKSYLVYAVVFTVVILLYLFLSPEQGKTLKVSSEDVTFSIVKQGVFEDVISVRANVEPLDTLYLDAIEGGRVESILVEDGDMVEKGQLLLVLSNPSVQISVIRSDADTTQQLNNIRTLELQFEQNRLSHKKDLVDINYNISLLEKKLERFGPLLDKNVINKSDVEDVEIEYNWYLNRRKLTLESQENDNAMRKVQLEQLKKASEQLQSNLAIARQNLENLSVRAPKSGRLTSFDLKEGQAVGVGARIGQIDDPNQYKLSAEIGEYYIGRVREGQNVEVRIQSTAYKLHVSKIYPQVINNKFKVDLLFDSDPPKHFRRGQTIVGSLELGDSISRLLVKSGAFYQDAGGNWAFVVSGDESSASKREITLGRKNSKFIEVLDGLVEGETIITSTYANYSNVDKLILK